MKESFIEQDFPIKEVSMESTREKNIRHGHISTLHIWWARRPLAASRATIYSALTSKATTDQERIEKLAFIAELSKWENSINTRLIERAQKDILHANDGVPPKILDPFAGGGAIPLEALRLGCDVYSSDLNPVAVLIEKATLEYPQRYGHPIPKNLYFSKRKWIQDNSNQLDLMEETVNPLLEDVKYWSKKVMEESWQELKDLYPSDPNGSIPIGYFWAWTIKCKNPACGCEIPLVKQTWLVKKKNKKIAYKFILENKQINFKLKRDEEIDFNPSNGTISRGKVNCPCCDTGMSPPETRREFQEGNNDQRLIALVLKPAKGQGKEYRLANSEDIVTFEKAKMKLQEKRRELLNDLNYDPVPNEEMPRNMTGCIAPPNYGLYRWGDLFNPRQQLALITFMEKIREIKSKLIEVGLNSDDLKVIVAYLGIIFDRLIDKNSNLVVYDVGWDKVSHVFGRQALPFISDYIEINPFTNIGWPNMTNWVVKVIDHCSKLNGNAANVFLSSANDIPFQDNFFDAVFTDPPYYNSVPYADMSDFFYVWLKRLLGDIFPELFSTPLSPKSAEICEMKSWDSERYSNKTKDFYESSIRDAFKEINRVLKPEGIIYIVFAHKSTDAWESIINAILRANLYITASWPIHTEMPNRLRASESAALASSIYMACRKRNDNITIFYNEIKPLIKDRIHSKLDQFWEEGIGGSDFFISAIGPAVEVFGKYANVEKLSGEKVTVMELLEFVRQVVSEYALSRILKSPQLGGIDIETRFYLIWRWTFGSGKIHFDDARKLAQAIGFHIEENWESGGIIRKDKEWISVKGPIDRRKDEIFQKRIAKRYPEVLQRALFEADLVQDKTLSMIDVLHQCLIFWDMGFKQNIAKLLEASGNKNNNDFWRTAQSISDVLPEGDKEKQLLQGFLYGKESYQTGKIPIEPKIEQKKLFGDEE